MSGLVLDLASLQTWLGDEVFKRAREVYVTQKVQDNFEVSASGESSWEVSGTVQGSTRERYRLSIEAEIDGAGVIHHLSGACTCPVGRKCKHMGALLMKTAYASGGVRVTGQADAETRRPFPSYPRYFAQDPTPPKVVSASERLDQGVSSWLEQFDAEQLMPPDGLDAAGEVEGAKHPDCAVFLLEPHTVGVQTRLQLRCATSRQLQKGGWGRLHKFRKTDPKVDAPQAKEAAQFIQALSRTQSQGYGPDTQANLVGEMGLLALKYAAQTERLFWTKGDPALNRPLTWAEPRALNWAWTSHAAPSGKDTLWQLVAEVDGATAAALFHHGVMLWVDEATLTVGEPVATNIGVTRLQTLLQSPPIPESSWYRHESALLRQLAGLPLPPIARPPAEWPVSCPRVRVRVVASSRAERASLGLAQALMSFEYHHLDQQVSGFWAHANTPVLVDLPTPATDDPAPANAVRALLRRDMPTELAARQALVALGLRFERNGRFSSTPHTNVNQQPWLAWVDDGFAAFKAAGMEVDVDPALLQWIDRADAVQAEVDGDQADHADSDWFELSLGIEVAGQRVNLLPVLPSLLGAYSGQASAHWPPQVYVPHPEDPDHRWLRVPTEPIKPWLVALMELMQSNPNMHAGERVRLSRMDMLRLSASQGLGEGIVWSGAQRMRELLKLLSGGANALQPVPLPQGLSAQLRPYQAQGLSWLQFLREYRLGGILADDMGLGKTVQTLAHLLVEKEAGRLSLPALIICPVSVMGNWQREAARFSPSLKVLTIHGQDRHEAAGQIAEHDVIVAPYSLLQRDRERWLGQKWSLVALDEAQNIKTPTPKPPKWWQSCAPTSACA